jgi:PAS domain S-box-containing protein
MFEFLTPLFDTTGFPARWNCGNWTPGHGWLHILSDVAIWSAYFAIPCILGYFVLRRRDVPFPTVFWLFGAFIFACGATHLMEAIIFWHPVYRLAGGIKLLTAIVSWGTVAALVPTIPKALSLRSPLELEIQVAARQKAEDALRRANAELELRVQERTAELAETNAALQYEREMLRITLASIGDAVIATDTQGNVTFLNPVAQTLTGWSDKESNGRPLETVFRIVNEKTRRTVENPAIRALRDGNIVGLANHTTLIARDGAERAIDDSAAPIRHEDGSLAGAVLIFRDVTQRRKADLAARMLAAIVESSDDAIIAKDVNGIITSWNKGAERIFGYTAAETVGHSVSMLAPHDRADEMPHILERIRQGERVEHFDTLRRAKDGQLVPISLTVSPVKDQDGEIVGASKIARDISDRKTAEEALREEKERLHATLNGIGDAVIVTDVKGVVTLMNPVAQKLTGWKDEATGRPLTDVFPIINEQTRQPVENPVNRVIREGSVVGLANHTVLIAKDGTQRPIEDSAAPVRGERGQVVGVVLVFRDATEQRQAQDAVQQSQRREKERADELEALLRAAPTPIWIAHDPECHHISGNPASFALLGLAEGSNVSATSPNHDPAKRGFREYRGDRPIPADELPLQMAAVGRTVNGAEVKFVFDDGRVRHIFGNATPLRNPDGSVRGSIAAFADVTPLKEAEAALRQSEERLAAELGAMTRLHSLSTRLLSATDLAAALDDLLENVIATTGADFGNVQLYSPELQALEIVAQRGFRPDFLTHFRLVRVDHGSACARAMQRGERTVIEDVGLDAGFEPHRHVAAAAGYRAVQSTPIKTRAGGVLGMLSTHYRSPHRPSERDQYLIDLYARHAADLIERIRFEEALKDADRRKNEFLATLAHELRNPLAPLRNAVELLQRSEGNAPVLEHARSIMGRQLDQMVRLVDDLLDMSRISQGKVQLRRERVELTAVVGSALEAVRPLLKDRDHELKVTLPSEPIWLDADATRLTQTISNLLNNAAKYTEKGGQIWLTGEKEGGEAVVSVRDTGIGIGAQHLSQVFEMFSQVAPALERSQGGLGIGLSLVRGVVELHGGKVEAKSGGLGTGSEFIVRLPIVDSPAPAPEEPSGSQQKSRPVRKCRILVVDDNRDAADTMAMMLELMGHEARTAYDGLEALETADSFRPTVVLLDIGMPRMNGYEVASHIRQKPWGKGATLIAITGWGQETDKRRALEAGFDHHLTKPVEAATLEKLFALIRPPTQQV